MGKKVKGEDTLTQKEMEQQKEIERLQNKIRSLLDAYERVSLELEQLKTEQKPQKQKGRPPVKREVKERILARYRKRDTMRVISKEEGIALSTVQKIIKEASEQSRIVYVYADKEIPTTIIDASALTQRVEIENLTDDMLSRAFGIQEHPSWEDYETFLETRCMPRTRYGIKEELHRMGIDSYDPFQILEKTAGRVRGDHQYLIRMGKDWILRYDQVRKGSRKGTDRRKKLLTFMAETEREWKLDESKY